MARKIGAVPTGGVSFVDARDAAALSHGHEKRPARRRLSARRGKLDLYKILWPAGTSDESCGAVACVAVTVSYRRRQSVDSLFKQWDLASPVEPGDRDGAVFLVSQLLQGRARVGFQYYATPEETLQYKSSRSSR